MWLSLIHIYHHYKVDIDALLAGLERRDLGQIAALLANSFEPVVMAHFPLIRDIKETLLAAGALAALMSGSGPTVYGLFAGREEANAAAVSYTHLDVYKRQLTYWPGADPGWDLPVRTGSISCLLYTSRCV